MRRYALVLGVVALASVLTGGLLVGVLLGPARQPETWKAALQRYLEFRALDDNAQWQIVTYEQATSPTRFDRGMSLASYGTGTYYQVQVAYPHEAQAAAPTSAGTQAVYQATIPMSTGVGAFASTGGRPLPYPPDEAWCVLLARDAVSVSRGWLAVVALHMDLYNAEWVVHEGGVEPFGDEVLDSLGAIGCDEVEKMAVNPLIR